MNSQCSNLENVKKHKEKFNQGLIILPAEHNYCNAYV